MATFADIANDVLLELNVRAAGETADPAELEDLRNNANRMLDTWNTERLMIYRIQENIYLLPSNKQSITIGTSGSLVATRPIRLESANTINLSSTAISGTTATTGAGDSILTDSAQNFTTSGVVAGRDLVYIISGTSVTAGVYNISTVGTTTLTLTANPGSSGSAIAYRVIVNPFRYPIDVHGTPDWWAGIQNRNYAGIPCELYYEPSWVNGTIHFYPYSSSALGLELYTWTPFSAFATVTETFSMPPGFQDAVMYNLAVRAAPMFGKELNPVTVDYARTSRAKIKSINAPIPYIVTWDYGMPSVSRHDYLDDRW
jgi:hypothetical protein